MLRGGESFEQGVTRKVVEETNLTPISLFPVCTFVVPTDAYRTSGVLIPGVRFLVSIDHAEPRLDPQQHTTFRWITLAEVDNLNWVPPLKEDLEVIVSRLRTGGEPTESSKCFR